MSNINTNTNRERMKPLPKLTPITRKINLPKPQADSQVKPLDPYREPVEEIRSLRHIGEIIESLRQDRRILFNVIHDEMQANGGNLASPDGDIWIQLRFGFDKPMTTSEIVNQHLKK